MRLCTILCDNTNVLVNNDQGERERKKIWISTTFVFSCLLFMMRSLFTDAFHSIIRAFECYLVSYLQRKKSIFGGIFEFIDCIDFVIHNALCRWSDYVIYLEIDMHTRYSGWFFLPIWWCYFCTRSPMRLICCTHTYATQTT